MESWCNEGTMNIFSLQFFVINKFLEINKLGMGNVNDKSIEWGIQNSTN